MHHFYFSKKPHSKDFFLRNFFLFVCNNDWWTWYNLKFFQWLLSLHSFFFIFLASCLRHCRTIICQKIYKTYNGSTLFFSHLKMKVWKSTVSENSHLYTVKKIVIFLVWATINIRILTKNRIRDTKFNTKAYETS
jgi:hypothetical protein